MTARETDATAGATVEAPAVAPLGARIGSLAGIGIYALACVLGLAAFLHPLWRPLAGGSAPGGSGAVLLLGLLVAFCCAALAFEAGSSGLGARAVALLGMLVALNSLLRFAENALPGPGEFSPVFAPIILVGYALGARMGFLMGALTLAVSAVITGGVGPWLPYQMLAAGWVGLTAGWLPRQPGPGPGGAATRAEIALLAVFGAAWGLGYGILLTLWDWSFLGVDMAAGAFAATGSDAASTATSRFNATLARFFVYYASRALIWDLFRAAGNAILILMLGAPVLLALRRFERRFGFGVEGFSPTGIVRTHPTAFLVGRIPPPPAPSPKTAGGGETSAVSEPFVILGQEKRLDADHMRETDSAPVTIVPLPPAVLGEGAGGGGIRPTHIHPRAWLAWLAGLALVASLTRNPLVLAGLALAVAVVGAALERRGAPTQILPVSIPRFACAVIPFAAIYNFLFAHGGTTVVARIPVSVPLLGGPLTLESLAYGALTGLALVLLFAAFVTFQRALSAREIVRLIPRAFGALTLISSVALTYVPATLKHIDAVREAQTLRGYRGRGVRAVAPLAVPLLVGGLERALALAESMTARGLAPPAGPPPTGARLAVLGGLAAVAAGWLGLAAGLLPTAIGRAMVAVGVASAVGALLLLGRRMRRTDYRPVPWTRADSLIAAAACLPALVWFTSASARAALAWSPYPTLAPPPPAPLLALALLGLAAPVVVLAKGGWPAGGAKTPGRPILGGERQIPGRSATPELPAALSFSPQDWGAGGAKTPANPTPIHFTAFHYRYPDAEDPILADANLAIPAGALTLVVGPSGSGKSTLLRAINGLVPHAVGGAVGGAVRVGALDPIALGPGPMSAHVGFVSGDPEAAFVLDGVADELAFALEQQGLSRADMRARVAQALARVGLAEAADRRIDTLSGGERQRVAIAAALALAPEVLVLDEPTSQLDDTAAAAVMDCLVDLVREGGRTVVVSEHRIDRVAPHAAWVIRLPAPGLPPVCGPAAAMLAGERRSGLALSQRSSDLPAPSQHPSDLPALSQLQSDFPALSQPLDPSAGLAPAVIEIDRVTFGYVDGDPPVLANLSLIVRAGEIVALTGASGCGKTTLLKLAVGLRQPDQGTVQVEGTPIAGRAVAEICQRVGYLPQDPSALLFASTVREELRVTLANHGQIDRGRETQAAAGAGVRDWDGDIDRLLETLGIRELEGRYPRDLSTGQRQRVALGAVLITRPAVLLLDEPTRGLDDAAIAALGELLGRLAAAGTGILVATHDRRLARMADRVVEIARDAPSTGA